MNTFSVIGSRRLRTYEGLRFIMEFWQVESSYSPSTAPAEMQSGPSREWRRPDSQTRRPLSRSRARTRCRMWLRCPRARTSPSSSTAARTPSGSTAGGEGLRQPLRVRFVHVRRGGEPHLAHTLARGGAAGVYGRSRARRRRVAERPAGEVVLK